MKYPIANPRLSFAFFLWVLLLSIPFWILGALMPDATKLFPIKLPISALMTFCPMIAAAILVYQHQKIEGINVWINQTVDYHKITNKLWYLPIVLLMPLLAFLSYWYLQLNGNIQPSSPPSFLSLLLFFIIYFIGAISEELGWSGYIITPLQNQVGAFKASLLIGILWALWHVIPYMQLHHTINWIVWQCIATVFLRVIMVWLFNHSGQSVFGMILFHTMINLSPYLFHLYDINYDPYLFTLSLFMTLLMVTIVALAKSWVGYENILKNTTNLL